MATVSVITPTYNRARFLPAAVASVLSQTFGDFELIIVDDGSEDNTPDVLKPFFADRRVRYVYQENQGQSHARNLALKQATGILSRFLIPMMSGLQTSWRSSWLFSGKFRG